MTNPKLTLIKYLENVQNELINLNILVTFLEFPLSKTNDEIFKNAWHKHSIFFDFSMFSFRQTLIIELYELLKKNNKRSLFWYLDQVNIHCKSLFDEKEIEIQVAELENFNDTIKSLGSLRDKFYAHRETRYFDNPNQFYDFGVSFKEVKKLLKLIEAIIHIHRFRLDETLIRCSFPSEKYIESIFEDLVLNERSNVKLKEKLNRSDIEIINANADLINKQVEETLEFQAEW